ncbi:MAG: hypothetical protein GY811_16355 [Myxococcales bacterium]|nr:hypothetical protein [Myxococcales bacterium]
MAESQVPAEVVDKTINNFHELDASGDKRTMTKMVRRLGKEQPALLQYASQFRDKHGDPVGEAAVFYGTLVWAMFDENVGKCPRLTVANISEAEVEVKSQIKKDDGIKEKAVHDRSAEELVARQPHIYSKLTELIEEDVREDAMKEETAEIIYPPTQVILEAFDAAIEGRRPGEQIGPVVKAKKIGRNELCPCDSGNKYKRCCGG